MSTPVPVFDPVPGDYVWIVAVGGIAAFIAAFGIGANDVANAFASSVGSKALKLWQAVVIAAIFEFGGAVLLGAGVTSTIRQGIADGEVFEQAPELLMLGMLCAEIGAGLWLLVATRLRLAVSTTHSIVGAIIGVFLVAGGPGAIDWFKVGMIIVSWFASPILSGIVSSILFFFVRYFLLRSENSLERTIRFYPILVATTVAINVFFIIYKGAPALGAEDMPIWQGILIALACGVGVAVLIQFLAVPVIRRRLAAWEERQKEKEAKKQAIEMEEAKIAEKAESADASLPEASSTDKLAESAPPPKGLKSKFKSQMSLHRDRLTGKSLHDEALAMDEKAQMVHDNAEVFHPTTERMYTYLQVFTAIFDSFAHGANDVANSIAPFAAIFAIYSTGEIPSKSAVPVWILALGGAGIVVGLVLYGYRIMQAIGMQLTKITPSRGFAIELGTAFTAVTFSILAVPISTTHCQVGSTTAVGLFDGTKGVNLKLLAITFLGWIFTMVFAGGVSAAIFAFAVYSPFVTF